MALTPPPYASAFTPSVVTPAQSKGKKARELFDRYVGQIEGVELVTMPSTSPANARRGKIQEWTAVLERILDGG